MRGCSSRSRGVSLESPRSGTRASGLKARPHQASRLRRLLWAGASAPTLFAQVAAIRNKSARPHGFHHQPHRSNFAESVVSPPVRAGTQRTRAYRPADTTKANATRFAVHPRIRHPSSLSPLSPRRHRAGIKYPPVSSYRRHVGAAPAHAQLRAAGYVEACALARGDLPTDTAAASFPRCRPDTDGPQVPRKGRGF